MSANQIALTGLNAAKKALDITAQNVANINTQGYSRQQVELTSIQGSITDPLGAGLGVEVSNIKRYTNDYTNNQLWSAHAFAASSDELSTQFAQLERIFSHDTASVSTAIDLFFGALNDATIEPSSIALRQQVMSEARAVGQQFNSATVSLDQQNTALSSEFDILLGEANSELANLAALNEKIMAGVAANANTGLLEDQRDELVASLSDKLALSVNRDDRNAYSIALKSGEPLLLGSVHANLSATFTGSGTEIREINLTIANTSFNLNQSLGGRLGALDEFQTNVIGEFFVSLDDMATNLAVNINDQLSEGVDLNGTLGAPLFEIQTLVEPARTLTLSTTLTATELAFAQADPININPGDNRNLLALIAIQDETFATGTSSESVSLSDAYNGMLSTVAISSRQAQNDRDTAVLMQSELLNQRDSLSAVNSDEEAARLLEYSKSFQANMKVLATVNQLLNELMDSF